MKRTIFPVILFVLLTRIDLSAQSTAYTLQQCIDSALTRNVQVKQTALLTEAAEIGWKQSRANLLPNLNATANHGINQGRSIDPFTNTYVNQSITYAGYGIVHQLSFQIRYL